MRVSRNITAKLQKLLENFPAVSLIGSRQSGKTELTKTLYPDWHYVDLENPNDFDIISGDPVLFFKEHPSKVIIDEAQQYPEIFKVLRGIIDNDRTTPGRFIVTGSSSPQLVKSISESLAGRAALLELGTLKFNEFLNKPLSSFYRIFETKTEQHEEILRGLQPLASHQQHKEFWFQGTFPEPALHPDKDFSNHWKQAYFDTYINRDIKNLFPKLDSIRYRRFVNMLAGLSGTIVNQRDLAAAVNISEPSARDYLDIANETYIWRKLSSFTHNINKQVTRMPKGHIRDSGLIHFLLKIPDADALYSHPIVGKSFESFIVEEIIKGIQATNTTAWSYHYYRTRSKSEIDLILHGPFGVLAVEIKHGTRVRKSDLRTLENFITEHNLPYGLVINNSEDVQKLSEKIFQIPARCI